MARRKNEEEVRNSKPVGDSLSAMRAWVMADGRWTAKGVHCPCCDGNAKVYERPLNAAMARSLLAIYRYFLRPDAAEWLNICQYLTYNTSVGDAAKLAYWGLIEPKREEPRGDGNPRNGLYKTTDLGWRFLQGEVTVPKYVVLYNASVLGMSEEQTTLAAALRTPFDYAALMHEARQPAALGG